MALPFLFGVGLLKAFVGKGLLVKLGLTSKITVASIASVAGVAAGASAYKYLMPKAVDAVNKALKEHQWSFTITQNQVEQAHNLLISIDPNLPLVKSMEKMVFKSMPELYQALLVKVHGWKEELAYAVSVALWYWIELVNEEQENPA
ncbi:hypothetical protein Nos7524_3243 [Nostoc sp. PCC 7524]|uniref:hypothetical protein n=1 Tax=Nostoc sp. (strain ATCC 29411 / PCC 7524) TaxID=28072 RepID=UPI00029F35A6|nr:hypothetical protein [Nostoc sp. PCC 7524]AFY49041.1 hypothetical protein Nos7524_3243 [Nostoc sp. PCC 7524]